VARILERERSYRDTHLSDVMKYRSDDFAREAKRLPYIRSRGGDPGTGTITAPLVSGQRVEHDPSLDGSDPGRCSGCRSRSDHRHSRHAPSSRCAGRDVGTLAQSHGRAGPVALPAEGLRGSANGWDRTVAGASVVRVDEGPLATSTRHGLGKFLIWNDSSRTSGKRPTACLSPDERSRRRSPSVRTTRAGESAPRGVESGGRTRIPDRTVAMRILFFRCDIFASVTRCERGPV